MPDLKKATATAIVALCASVGVPDKAEAYDQVYGGGSSLAGVVYRVLMDTWDIAVSSDCGATATDLSGANSLMFYAGLDSGPGKRALLNHNGSANTSLGLGAGPPSVPPPWTSGSCATQPHFVWNGYPSYHFAAAEDVITPADIAAYNANGGPANWGKLSQIPAFITPIEIAYNPAGLNSPVSGLGLTRKQLCGIFSGHITNWADPIFATSGVGGGPLTSASLTINVIHFSEPSFADADGTTFLLSNSLKTQCAGMVGPNNAFLGDNTPSLWEFNWTDRTVPASACPAIPVRASSAVNWPDFQTDQCGAAIISPSGSLFGRLGEVYSEGVACRIALTAGAIGYVSPNFSNQIPATNTLFNCGLHSTFPAPPIALLQNQYGVDNDPPSGPFTFIYPSLAAIQAAMASATPNFADDAALTNPLNWSTQGLVPNPTDPNAYPITGFSWLELYQCYNDQISATGNVLGTIKSFLSFLYGGSSPGTAAAILNSHGFATIPAAWGDQVGNLLINSSAQLGVGGTGVCTGIPGA